MVGKPYKRVFAAINFSIQLQHHHHQTLKTVKAKLKAL